MWNVWKTVQRNDILILEVKGTGRCKKKFPYGKQKRQACHDKQEINYS